MKLLLVLTAQGGSIETTLIFKLVSALTSNSVSVSGSPNKPPSISSPAFSISSIIGRIPVCGLSLII